MAMPLANAAVASEKKRLEEVIVTASKREQRLLDVPMSIATMSGDELEIRGVDNIQDLSFAVPGLTMREDGPGSYQVFLRGIANAHGGGALTSIYQDEIPMVLTGTEILPVRTLDLERIEVLKGPQGTLYGQGAVGGAIRYITARPNMDGFSGRLEAEAYSVSEGDMGLGATAIINTPVVEDKFAIRLVADIKDGGGWQDQPEAGIKDGNDEELKTARLKALWLPTDELEVLATAITYKAEYELGQGYEQPDRTVYVAVDPSTKLIDKEWDYDVFNLELTYDLGFAELLSSSTYTDMEVNYPFSYFGGPETIYEGDLSGYSNRYNSGDQFTQELRLSSTGDKQLQWTVGLFYSDMAMDLSIPEVVTEFFGVVYLSDYFTEQTSKSYSVFADVAYQLTDKLNVGVGVRYFEDKQTDLVVGSAGKQEGEFDSVDPRVYMTYALDDNMSIYASAAKGFRSGGFNGFDFGGDELPDFDPESLWSYEVGYKASLLDGELYVDMAVYYTEYDDMLRRGLVFIQGRGFQSLISNIGKVEVTGFDGSINWKATDALTLDASVAIIDAEVKAIGATDTANIPGDPIDYVPDYSFTLGATYNFMWSDTKPGFVRLGYSYRDEMPYVDRTSFPEENVDQFSDKIGLFDARIGLTMGDVSFELYGQNLTDENKYIDPYSAWNNANRTRPRTVGLKVAYDF
ncbi:TonB-dependent receptor [Dasania sp. GY-19]|uniref:TonB-dependent receptor n=2 Tax=Spongiibacteraceae TaxID=1706375 RepID=A0A9J6RIS2_9GAMM|nr:TonB-dependent receptor [Dasania phycosphaerae]MCZ0864274.1 TonB-dependent receptor [Dasania phycosphaerae]